MGELDEVCTMSPRSTAKKTKKRRQIPVQPARTASDVCLRCGMCCDGTLFPKGVLVDGEEEFAESLGLTVVPGSDGGSAFALPCPKFVDGCCSIYAERRPSVCSGYQCALLPEYESGRMSLDECLDVIELVKGFARRVEEFLGLAPGSYTSAILERYVNELPSTAVADHQPLLMTLLRLSQVGTRYFGWTSVPVEASEALARAVTKQEVPDAVVSAPVSGSG